MCCGFCDVHVVSILYSVSYMKIVLILANNVDPDEMPQNVTSHMGLHYSLIQLNNG